MSLFLSEKENSVIYICDDSDNRHNARKRKYDGWFNKNDNNKFEKFDLDIKVEDSENLSSLIVPRKNPNKEALTNLFFEKEKKLREK